MADSRMRDDGFFREQLNATADDLIEAFRREYGQVMDDIMRDRDPNQSVLGGLVDDVTDFVAHDSYDPFKDRPYANFVEFEERTRNFLKQFRGYNVSGGTEQIDDELGRRLTWELEQLADSQQELNWPGTALSTRLAGWTGPPGSAAEKVHNEFIPDLQQSLANQLNAARSLQAIIKTHGAVVVAAREAILHVVDETIARLGEAREARSQQNADLLRSLATTAISIIGGIEAAPAAFVRQTLLSVGGTLVSSRLSVSGNDMFEIADSMEARFRDLAEMIVAEEELVRLALDDFTNSIQDHRVDFLPPDVNPPAPVVSQRHGPI